LTPLVRLSTVGLSLSREEPALAVIDAHQHFWNPSRVAYDWLGPDLGPINRAIEFEELAPLLAATGVERTVLVQSADNAADTDYMFEVAAAHPEIAAVVGWVPLDDPDAAARRLPDLRANPVFAGIRNLVHTKPDPDWLLRPDVDASLGILAAADVPFDVVSVLPRHLEHIPTLSNRHPDLRMVIDHLSKPPIRAGDDEPWLGLITRAAENPRVFAKVSGLYPSVGDLAGWTAADVRPYLQVALELFGADRLMFGGDWPISILAGGYVRVWEELSVLFDELSPVQRTAILGGTAARFYGIPPERLPEARP
jgi:L-fuconolactonase